MPFALPKTNPFLYNKKAAWFFFARSSGRRRLPHPQRDAPMNIKKLLIRAVIFMNLFAFLTGCRQEAQPVYPAPVPLPQGAGLTALYITHQGMAAGPYFILQAGEGGAYMKISNTSPAACWAESGAHPDTWKDNSPYLAFADTVTDAETASLLFVTDPAPLQALEEALAASGAVGWDGFDKALSGKKASDAGDSYQLYLEFSNGDTVTVLGKNTCPSGFTDLLQTVLEIFYNTLEPQTAEGSGSL